MIIPWCAVGKHPVTTDQTMRLIRATNTDPPPPAAGWPRGSTYRVVPWYPHAESSASILVCSDHDTGPWATAPTASHR